MNPMSQALLLGLSLILGGRAHEIVRRGPQTNATCTSDFSWMANAEGLSPCLVAAYVNGACGDGNFDVEALANDTHYDGPGSGADGVTPCSCSWAWYNMLMACTACQGLENSIFGWAPWKANCDSKYLSNTSYFPFDQDYTIGTTLPYWGGQNPLDWDGGRFDPVAAKTLHEDGHSDLNGTAAASTTTAASGGSSTPVGAIVGGVIGGLVVIACTAFTVWWLLRRHKRLSAQAPIESAYGLPEKPAHSRTVSDFSGTYNPSFSTYTGPTTPSAHNHASNASYFGSMHGTSILMSPATTSVPLMPSHTAAVAPQDVIVPFTSSHSPSQSIDRKDGLSFMTYESPAGIRALSPTDDSFSTAGDPPPARRRMNPPAYSPSAYPSVQQQISDSVSSGSGMGHHAGKESQDSALSYAAPARNMNVVNASPEPTVTEFAARDRNAQDDNDDEAAGVDHPISPEHARDDFDVSRLA